MRSSGLPSQARATAATTLNTDKPPILTPELRGLSGDGRSRQ